MAQRKWSAIPQPQQEADFVPPVVMGRYPIEPSNSWSRVAERLYGNLDFFTLFLWN